MKCETLKFVPPNSRGVQKFEDRAVSQHHRVFALEVSQELHHLRYGENGAREFAAALGPFEIVSGIREKVAVLSEIAKKLVKSGDVDLFGGAGEKLFLSPSPGVLGST